MMALAKLGIQHKWISLLLDRSPVLPSHLWILCQPSIDTSYGEFLQETILVVNLFAGNNSTGLHQKVV